MKNLAVKLLEIQKEVGAIKKGAENPFFKSRYADINAFIEVVKPILSKHGVVLLQPLVSCHETIVAQDGFNTKASRTLTGIKTVLIDAETGETYEEETPIPLNPDPQKMGSTITYYRRYALQSMLFLETEDDDGNKASGKVTSTNDDF